MPKVENHSHSTLISVSLIKEEAHLLCSRFKHIWFKVSIICSCDIT